MIDPKGDLGNLLLQFPNLSTQEFLPWINEEDARKKGFDPETFAKQQADLWRNGLAEWHQDGIAHPPVTGSPQNFLFIHQEATGITCFSIEVFQGSAESCYGRFRFISGKNPDFNNRIVGVTWN